MKRYIQGSDPTIRVPMREIALTNGTAHTVYDTSGPYTDPEATSTSTRACRSCAQPGSTRATTRQARRGARSRGRT